MASMSSTILCEQIAVVSMTFGCAMPFGTGLAGSEMGVSIDGFVINQRFQLASR